MCGIVGTLRCDGRHDGPAVLEGMTAALAHRGPEGRGVRSFSEGALDIGLGHTRLRVIDLSDDAAQPMANDDRTVWVTFNGEIYNYQALRASLEARGARFRTASDTEVLLRLYEAAGGSCVSQLDGMFAFGIWDGRTRTLVLARDRFGKKPLFYWAGPGLFAFASEMKALFRHPAIVPEVNPESIPAFFLYGYAPTPETSYRGVRALPPGHLLRVDAQGGLHLERYWDLPLRPAGGGRPPSEAEAASRVRELLIAAVRKRLIADVPLGAFLSGGIDSSIVVGLMSRLTGGPVRTFSIGFAGDARFNETAYAREAAARFGTTHTEFVVGPPEPRLVERLVWHHDGPFADSSAVPTYLLARLAREHVTVALNGDGGDEVFAGYLRFAAALLSERFPRWMRRAASALLSGVPAGGHRSLSRYLKKFAEGVDRPLMERYSQWVSVCYDDLARLVPGTSRAGGVWSPLGRLQPHLERAGTVSPLSRLLYVNAKTYLLDDLLVKQDRCTMAHALEARCPFLDRGLAEYVFALPDAMKLRWAQTKRILRLAFSDLVPPAILRRGKMGFGAPLEAWFRGTLRDYLRDLVLAPDARLRGYLDQSYVRELVQAHEAGRADYAPRLWAVLTFEVWLRSLSRVRDTDAAMSGASVGAP